MSQRVLFITLSNVGDAVMSTAVLEAVHQHYPDALVDIVADKRSSDLFLLCPYRGEIIHKHKRKPLRGALELLKQLRPRYYDLIVDLRTDGLAWLLRGKRRLTKWRAKPYGPHSLQRLMGVINRLHGSLPIPATRVWLDETRLSWAQQTLSTLPAGRLLAIGPASQTAKKNWLPENYSTLANRLSDLFSGVILVGGPNDTIATNAIAAGLSLPYINLAGQTDLLQVAALLCNAGLFAGSDSGLGHIAAAMQTPGLSLFSNASPEQYRPWGDQAQWLVAPGGDVHRISVVMVENKIRQMMMQQK